MKFLLVLVLAGSAVADQAFQELSRVGDTNTTGCYLQSHVRGAGVPITSCPDGQERSGLLCYPKCRDGYYPVGPVCWQSCPSTHIDTGAFCQAQLPWGDNSACPVLDKCGLTFARGCVKCPQGFTANGCVCSNGATFAKGSYGRGAGRPLVCAPDLHPDAGLCYRDCPANYNGVGPVCWGSCPANLPYPCGALCLQSSTECRDVVKGNALAVLELGFEIAQCAISNGTNCDQAALKESLEHLINSLAYPVCN